MGKNRILSIALLSAVGSIGLLSLGADDGLTQSETLPKPSCPARPDNAVFLPCGEVFDVQEQVGKALIPYGGQQLPSDGPLLDLLAEGRVVRSQGGVLEMDLNIVSGTPENPMMVGSRPYRVTTYEGQDRLGGVVASYNGVFPGPTLLAQPGDALKLKVHDKRTPDSVLQKSDMTFDPTQPVPEATNIHTHGMLVSPKGEGDNIYRAFSPGHSYLTKIDIPEDHDQGVNWYHPHIHGSTAPQVYGGMAGLLQVGEILDAEHRAQFKQYEPKLLVFTGMALAPTKEDPELFYIGPAANGTSPTLTDPNPLAAEGEPRTAPDYRPSHLINGQLNPIIAMRPNETQVWVGANVNPFSGYSLALVKLDDGGKVVPDAPLFRTTILAQDGNDHFTPIPGYLIKHRDPAADFGLGPGKRLTWSITAPSKPGDYYLVNVEDYAYTRQVDSLPPQLTFEPPASFVPSMILATVRVDGDAEERSVPEFGPRFDSGRLAGEATLTRQIAFDFDEHSLRGRINFGYFPNVGVIQSYSGEIERWVVGTYSQVSHPLHLHQGQFVVEKIEYYEDQALTKLRKDLPENPLVNRFPREMDTFTLPGRSKVYLKLKSSDFTGKFVMHCHVLLHEDSGMMVSAMVSQPRSELMTVIPSGTGNAPLVSMVRADNGEKIREFYAFERDYRGGLTADAGNLVGPYRSYVAAGKSEGEPVVRVFARDNTEEPLLEFKPFGGEGDGVSVAVGDIDGDAIDEIVVGSGKGTIPSVAVYDIVKEDDGSFRASLLLEVPVFDGSYSGAGVRVASGDVDGDNWDDIIAANGPGAANRLSVLGGQILSEAALSDDEFGVSTGDPNLDRELKLSICRATSLDSVIVDVKGIIPGEDGLNITAGLLGGGFATYPPLTTVGFNPPVEEPYRDLIAVTPAASRSDPQVTLFRYNGPGGHVHLVQKSTTPSLLPVALFSPFPGEISPEGGLLLSSGLTSIADPNTPITGLVSAMRPTKQRISYFDSGGALTTKPWATSKGGASAVQRDASTKKAD